ncbi:MAG: alpha/beta hydrolase [Gammaproteobacteria bacterium]|nr:alpha/beta hydrolase [Gammaproteobacteria bacterium]
MKVYFSHGKESGPWGSKIKRLAKVVVEHGCEIESIDYSDLMDPDLRVKRLLDIIHNEDDEIILVGSSMGGYVSLEASEQVEVKGVFLLAPALFMPGYEKQLYRSLCRHIEIVHGWSDDVIPVEHSMKFAQEADCSLHLISGDHRLNDSIEQVVNIFENFLNRNATNY